MTYGNLAYKYDYPRENKQYSRTKEAAPQTGRTALREKSDIKTKTQGKAKKKTNVKKAAPGEKRNKKQEMGYFGKICCVLVLAASAIFMIIQFVEVNETQADLAAAKNDYNFELSVTAQKNFELEQSIDLSKIEKEATTRLGMRRPEKYQTVYLDVKRDDMTEKTADEVEGFGNRAAKFFSSLISNIVDFFSI